MFSVLADTHAGLRVHLVPSRAAHLTRSRRREDQKLERELDGGVRTRRPHRCERRGDLTVRQRRHVLHDVAERTWRRPASTAAGRVKADPAAHPPVPIICETTSLLSLV